MIVGRVVNLEAIVPITVFGPRGTRLEIHAVIDTGYTGTLTLPFSMIYQLELAWDSDDQATLGDGSICEFDVYTAQIEWDGNIISTYVDESESESFDRHGPAAKP